MALTKSDEWAINDMCKSFKDERSDYIKLMSKYKADKERSLYIDNVSGPGFRYSKHLATAYTHAANRNKLKYIAAGRMSLCACPQQIIPITTPLMSLKGMRLPVTISRGVLFLCAVL